MLYIVGKWGQQAETARDKYECVCERERLLKHCSVVNLIKTLLFWCSWWEQACIADLNSIIIV